MKNAKNCFEFEYGIFKKPSFNFLANFLKFKKVNFFCGFIDRIENVKLAET
jgi:hypothetical protein